MLSLESLFQEWEAHPLGHDRAVGGRRALGGFRYQLYLSLDRFFARVLEGDREAQFLFDGLSDLAEVSGDLVYLTQVKSTLTPNTLKSAVSEALDVERFLLERHPDLRPRFRYQLAARRFAGRFKEPAELSPDEMHIAPADVPLWEGIRDRWLPSRIQGSPEVELAIKLWPHARNPFKLIRACLGAVFDGVGSGSPSSEIARKILEIWDGDSRKEPPPLRLLGPGDFETGAAGNNRVVHGVRPALADIRDGCFMERPVWVEKILEVARSAWETAPRDPDLPALPVVWITGPSGAGKSVLLLQAARELLLRGDADAVNYLAEFPHHLPAALRFAAEAGRKLIIAVDDAFSPDNRDPAIWRSVVETIITQEWPSPPLILTCGPPEQRKAFEKESQRHRGMRLFTIEISSLEQEERLRFHDWYQARTSSAVPLVSEPIFVAATWIYELARRINLSPEAFARRFDDRLVSHLVSSVALRREM